MLWSYIVPVNVHDMPWSTCVVLESFSNTFFAGVCFIGPKSDVLSEFLNSRVISLIGVFFYNHGRACLRSPRGKEIYYFVCLWNPFVLSRFVLRNDGDLLLTKVGHFFSFDLFRELGLIVVASFLYKTYVYVMLCVHCVCICTVCVCVCVLVQYTSVC